MKSKKNLVFLGMMGSGKTSIGLIVSKKLNINFIDTDKEIEKEVGMQISKIFEIEGENFFRKLEEKMTLKILKKNSIIILHRHKKEEDILPKNFKIVEEKKYGISKIIFLSSSS